MKSLPAPCPLIKTYNDIIMKRLLPVFLLLSLFLGISCTNKTSAVTNTDNEDHSLVGEKYSYRPDIRIRPIDSFMSSLTLTVSEGHNGIGEIVYRDQMLDWCIQNRDLQFKDFSVNEIETGLEAEIEKSALILFEIGHHYCCMAGVSEPIKIFADMDVEGYAAGQDLSELFVVKSANPDAGLVNVKYPEMTPVKIFGEIKDRRVKFSTSIPIKEYFAVGTSPLMSISSGCILSASEGHESLTQNLLDGSLTLHFELPIIGINSKGQEESCVLTGTIPAKES